MKCFKGFDKDLRCKGFQYEVGKEYETERAEICDEGFHACEFPLDVLGYYNPADSRFCEVELDANEQTHNDSMRVGKKIKIGAEIGLSGLVKAGVKFILEKADFEHAQRQTPATVAQRQTPATVAQRQTPATVAQRLSKRRKALLSLPETEARRAASVDAGLCLQSETKKIMFWVCRL